MTRELKWLIAIAALLLLPAASTSIVYYYAPGTFTAAQSFTDGDLILLGSSSGSSALHTSATGGGAITFQAGAHTVAALTIADQTVSGGANVTSESQSAGNITVDCGARPAQYIANTGAFTITAPSNDGY